MPLKCFRGEEEIFAFKFDSNDLWERLRAENLATKCLRMACCGADVVLKTSPLGTKFFAHSRKGPCETAPESAEHLLAKQTIIDGLAQTNWTAMSEQVGMTQNGERWAADVLAIKGDLKVAFEVQWSRQTEAETRRRQTRYNDAKVRGLWLFRQKDFPFGKDVPAFQLLHDNVNSTFSVVLPSTSFHIAPYIAVENWRNYWQIIELSRFAAGAVSGRLKFSPALGMTVPLLIGVIPSQCWRCKAKTRLVSGVAFELSKLLPGHPNIFVSLDDLDRKIPTGRSLIADWFPRRILAKHGIGEIKVRNSTLAVEHYASYLSNGCVKCGALQARHFQPPVALTERDDELTVEVVLDASWAAHLNDIQRWWFDEST